MKVQHRNPKPYATRILNTTLRILTQLKVLLTHMDDMTSPRLTNTWEVLERAHLCLLPSRNFHSLQEESSAAAAEAAQGFDATGSLSQIQFGHRLRQAWVQKSPRNACLGRTLWLSSRRPPPSGYQFPVLGVQAESHLPSWLPPRVGRHICFPRSHRSRSIHWHIGPW